ncbi:MerR family DNA-binding transcriptional regulator [Allostreptomyces psammosilenae]|uniref:DNA-binding transcriptional MerR regulator n=1 Tax=Allostreptomyces psammosilenae TaxID=1892865 RepID=A0A852ZU09_9ACTN|nr:MerR family DNA-binding transcriptional regulator [Allostreptomyces psammosilenae]NYI04770.1 DNA-binding transcriptional MerR regulator [Allostreptomyces psammosilenae]
MRPVDLARPHGLSGQAVRNYEAAGILPAAERTPSGYRRYTARHAAALRTFLALVPAHGHAAARSIMTLLNAGRTDEALTVIDRGHAELLTDRRTLDAIEQALTELNRAPDGRPSHRHTTIGALAHRLGLRPATLRRWERAGLLHPTRDPATGYRTYSPGDVRDAHIVHQLRRSAYLLVQIAPLLAELRDTASPASVASAIADRRGRLHARALAMLHASAELGRYLGVEGGQTGRG